MRDSLVKTIAQKTLATMPGINPLARNVAIEIASSVTTYTTCTSRNVFLRRSFCDIDEAGWFVIPVL